MDRRDQLVEMRKSERIRLAQPHEGWLEESLLQVIAMLDRQIAALETRMEALLASARSLGAQKAILCSAPGVGTVRAGVLLAHLPELGHRDRRAISALAGVAPIACDFGTLRGKRCISGGRKRVATPSIWQPAPPADPAPSRPSQKPCATRANRPSSSSSPSQDASSSHSMPLSMTTSHSTLDTNNTVARA